MIAASNQLLLSSSMGLQFTPLVFTSPHLPREPIEFCLHLRVGLNQLQRLLAPALELPEGSQLHIDEQ